MSENPYKIYSVDELRSAIKTLTERSKKIKDCGDKTYNYLFEGLDIDLLILYSNQIKISMQYSPSDTGRILLDYSEKILALVPLWRQITELISKIIKKVETTISACDEDNPSEELTEAFEKLLDEIDPLYKKFNTLINPISEQQSDLTNFITAKLDDAITAAKTDSRYMSFVSLLVNSKLTSGTYASVKNLGIMFSLIINDLSNAVWDLKQCEKSPITIYIDLESNAEIFGVLKTVSDKINKSLEKFKMIKSAETPAYFDYAPTENPEINALYQKVAAVTETVVKCKKEPSFGKTSFMMLKLMTGDTNVLSQIPTLSIPTKATSQGTYAVDFGVNGDDTLVSETSAESIQESAGLFGMSKDDVINILSYVKLGLQLPITEADAANYLGYTGSDPFSADHPEFSPLSFANFYQPFNTHASLWADLENGSSGIIAQSNDLGKYGSLFKTRVDLIVQMLSNLDVTNIENIQVPSEKDQTKMKKLSEALLDFQKSTNGYASNAQALLNKLLGFQTTLRNNLQPSAEVMKSKMDALDIAEETKTLKAEIDELNRQIKSKTDEYNKDVGLAFTGAAGLVLGPLGIISWAVTGGVYGDRAEKVRKERNKLQSECDAKTKLYNNLNKVSGAVEAATSNIHNLGISIANAVIGLSTLVAVWNSISTDVGNAAASLAQLNSKSDIFDFIFDLSDAATSWGNVPDVTTQLLAMFNDARKAVSDKLLDTTATDVYTLDTMVWKDNAAAIGDVTIDLNSKYMPVLKEKAGDLKYDAQIIYDIFTFDLTELCTAKLPNIDTEIEMYNKFKSKLDINPDDETAKSNIDRITQRVNGKNTEFCNSLKGLSKTLKDNADILHQNTRKDLSALGFYTQLNNECKRFATVISDQTELMQNNFVTPMNVLMNEIKELDGAIEKEVDPENMIANFKKFLPSSEEVSAMITAGATSPEQGAVEAAKTLYNIGLNALDVFGKTIKLCSNIEKRSKLYDELAELRRQMKTCEKSLQEMLSNDRELKELINLYKPLGFFAANGAGLAEYLDEMNVKFQSYAKNQNYTAYVTLLDKFSNLEQLTAERSTISLPGVGYCIKTLPQLDSYFRPYSGGLGDETGGTAFSFEQGYGNISKAGAVVQLGVTGHIDIDLEITSLSEKFYSDTTEQLDNTFSHETTSEMQKSIDNNDQQSWWFAFLSGGSSSHQTSDELSKQQNGEVTFSSSKVFNSATQSMEKNKQKFRVKGSFDIVGQSMIPTTVYLFIETLTITTSDGNTIIVPTNNVAAADGNGNPSPATPTGNLNITPIF